MRERERDYGRSKKGRKEHNYYAALKCKKDRKMIRIRKSTNEREGRKQENYLRKG